MIKGKGANIIFPSIPESLYIPNSHPILDSSPVCWFTDGKLSATN